MVPASFPASSESHLPEWSVFLRDVCAAAALIVRLALWGLLNPCELSGGSLLVELVSSRDNISLSLWIPASLRLLGQWNAEIIARCSG